MAQPIFKQHPLEQYLRDAGEVYELIPGASQELLEEIDIDRHLYSDPPQEGEEGDMEWRPQCLVVGLNLLESFLSSAKPSKPSNPFVERFKYNVISSSLLSSSLANLQSSRSSPASIPGRLGHSRSSSLDIEGLKADGPIFSYSTSNHYKLTSLAAVATAIFMGVGNRFMATLCLGGLSFLAYHLLAVSESPTHDFTPTFTSLDELVAASAAWESTVQDAIQTLEKEEATILRASSTTPATTSLNSLRISLHTTLQTTRTQSDNIRQLFSALTCPSELSQLSEMYAPPSPLKSPLSLVESSPRPYSFPSRQINPTTPQNKRSTWHASYSSLANAGSPTNMFRRREKQRSNVSTLFQEAVSPTQSASAPVTPSHYSPPPTYTLSKIAEDIQKSETADEFGSSIFQDDNTSFGPAALGLHRKRQADGFGPLSPPPDRYSSMSELRSPRNQRMSAAFSSSSRYTAVQAPRHPLSLFTLNQTLQNAVAAKRYACSHLLALRFHEDEEEYWENVRSMMELLTSTFGDEAARLAEALEDVERQHLRDQNPTPDTSLEEFDERKVWMLSAQHDRVSSSSSSSFAPMPSHLSRFAAHVAAITSALEDAREHLQECVDSLKESPPSSSFKGASSPLIRNLGSIRRQRSMTGLDGRVEEGGEEEEHKAILAYDRLRRELGMALRECERGKQRLVDILHPPPVVSSDDDDDEEEGVPGLGHDASDESDNKPDPVSPLEDEDGVLRAAGGVVVEEGGGAVGAVDDVTSHLLMSTSIQHLPPQGIEQVYEADTGGVIPFTREKSKMSREERIRAIKAKREAAAAAVGGDVLGGLLFQGEVEGRRGKVERWGPGGEVVQELKDVIWKVGERRRKMQEKQQQQQQKVGSWEDGTASLPPLPESPTPSSPRSLEPLVSGPSSS